MCSHRISGDFNKGDHLKIEVSRVTIAFSLYDDKEKRCKLKTAQRQSEIS